MKQSDRYEMSAAHRRALWFVAIFAGILLTFSLAWTAYTLIASFPAALVVTGPAIALTSTMTWATTKMLSGTARAVVISSAGIEVTSPTRRRTTAEWSEIRGIEGFSVDLRE